MCPSNRRQFIKISVASVAMLAGTRSVLAQPMLELTNPQAVALGYVDDVKNIDTGKFPKYQAGQHCANCQLYAAKDASTGTCSAFPGKLVAGNGWCNLWVKKAG